MQDDNIYNPPEAELEQPTADTEVKQASRISRLVASLIDTFLILLLYIPAIYFTGVLDTLFSNTSDLSQELLLSVGALLVYLLLNGYLLATDGQTLGKKLVGIRIVDSESGDIADFKQAFMVRYLPVYLASQIPVIGQFLSLADAVRIFLADKRCFHDIFAGTRVVEVARPNKRKTR